MAPHKVRMTFDPATRQFGFGSDGVRTDEGGSGALSGDSKRERRESRDPSSRRRPSRALKKIDKKGDA